MAIAGAAGVTAAAACAAIRPRVALCVPGDRRDKVAPTNPRDRAAQAQAEHGFVKDTRSMWRDNPHEVDSNTLVVAVFGITGGGKSSTCNTMIGSRERLFEHSSAIMSVTKAVSYRDYCFYRRPCRVIDTPGLSDTNRSRDEIVEELDRFKAFAPNGLSAILVVIPHGRFTPEQEGAIRDIHKMLGPTGVKHSMVVFTHCLDRKNKQQVMRRDELLDEVSQLPRTSALRKLIHDCSHRVVPVENILEPGVCCGQNSLARPSSCSGVLVRPQRTRLACSCFRVCQETPTPNCSSADLNCYRCSPLLQTQPRANRERDCTSACSTRLLPTTTAPMMSPISSATPCLVGAGAGRESAARVTDASRRLDN